MSQAKQKQLAKEEMARTQAELIARWTEFMPSYLHISPNMDDSGFLIRNKPEVVGHLKASIGIQENLKTAEIYLFAVRQERSGVGKQLPKIIKNLMTKFFWYRRLITSDHPRKRFHLDSKGIQICSNLQRRHKADLASPQHDS